MFDNVNWSLPQLTSGWTKAHIDLNFPSDQKFSTHKTFQWLSAAFTNSIISLKSSQGQHIAQKRSRPFLMTT